MIDKSYRILEWMKRKNIPCYELVFKILKLFVNVFFPVIHSRKKICKKNLREVDEKIIVSFTTFPPRIDTVWQTAYTLLKQTVRVDHVILWLADSQFDSIESLPKSLTRLMEYGLEIKFCEDLRPHKKYYYSMKEYPDAIVITVDDDVYYPSFLVEQLYQKHLEYPEAICCNWAHRIKLDSEGNILSYEKWEKGVAGYDTDPSFELNQVGYEGVLYPANTLDNRCFDKELIKKLALNADDLWLKAMSYLNGKKVVRSTDVAYRYFGIIKSQTVALNVQNCGNNKNDEAIQNIVSYFPEIKKKEENNE